MQETTDVTKVKPPMLENALFNARKFWLTLFIALTGFLLYHAAQVRPDASFEKMIPANHEFIQNYFKYGDDLSSLGNAIRVVVETKDGTIFNPEYQEVLRQVTDELNYVAGVNRSGIRSIWTPNVRWSEVTEEGFVGGPVIPDSYNGDEASIEQLRQNILRSGEVGNLVANNFQSALIYVPLNEIDPETGERLDYYEFGQNVEQQIRDKFGSDVISIKIVGFAKVVADLIDGALQVGGLLSPRDGDNLRDAVLIQSLCTQLIYCVVVFSYRGYLAVGYHQTDRQWNQSLFDAGSILGVRHRCESWCANYQCSDVESDGRAR